MWRYFAKFFTQIDRVTKMDLCMPATLPTSRTFYSGCPVRVEKVLAGFVRVVVPRQEVFHYGHVVKIQGPPAPVADLWDVPATIPRKPLASTTT